MNPVPYTTGIPSQRGNSNEVGNSKNTLMDAYMGHGLEGLFTVEVAFTQSTVLEAPQT